MRAPSTVLELPAPAELCQASFELARKMLVGCKAPLRDGTGEEHLVDEMPIMLVCPQEALSEEFADWLWDHSRVTAVSHVPAALLKGGERSWALEGYRHTVVSIWPA